MSLAADGRLMFAALEERNVPYMVVGALAQAIYASPRFTHDLDIQVQIPEPPESSSSTWLGTIIEERSKDPVFGQDVLIVHIPTHATPIEVFLTGHWFTEQALARRREAHSTVFDRVVPVPTLEDHILLKACHHQSPTRSAAKAAQDLVDIEEAARRHADDLDSGYLRSTAELLDVATVVERILMAP